MAAKPSLPKEVKRLLVEVFAEYGDDQRKEAEQDPVGCLVSLLTQIREDNQDVSSTLHWTVEKATWAENRQEAVDKAKETV